MENNVPRTLFEARKVAGSAKYIQNLKLHSLPLRLFSQCSVLVMFTQLTFSLSDSALAVTSNGAVIPKSLNMNWIIFKKNVTWKQSQNFKGCKNLLPTAEGEVAQPGGHRNKALPGGFKQEITGNAFHPYMTWGWHTGGERHCQWTSVVWQTPARFSSRQQANLPSWWACWFLGRRLLSPLLPPNAAVCDIMTAAKEWRECVKHRTTVEQMSRSPSES